MQWLCRYVREGESSGVSSALLRDSAEMLRIVLHHLLAHGSGLSLGPDCDGVLNFMDSDTEVLENLATEPEVKLRQSCFSPNLVLISFRILMCLIYSTAHVLVQLEHA